MIYWDPCWNRNFSASWCANGVVYFLLRFLWVCSCGYWTSCSGSFTYGWRGNRRLCLRLRRRFCLLMGLFARSFCGLAGLVGFGWSGWGWGWRRRIGIDGGFGVWRLRGCGLVRRILASWGFLSFKGLFWVLLAVNKIIAISSDRIKDHLRMPQKSCKFGLNNPCNFYF